MHHLLIDLHIIQIGPAENVVVQKHGKTGERWLEPHSRIQEDTQENDFSSRGPEFLIKFRVRKKNEITANCNPGGTVTTATQSSIPRDDVWFMAQGSPLTWFNRATGWDKEAHALAGLLLLLFSLSSQLRCKSGLLLAVLCRDKGEFEKLGNK